MCQRFNSELSLYPSWFIFFSLLKFHFNVLALFAFRALWDNIALRLTNISRNTTKMTLILILCNLYEENLSVHSTKALLCWFEGYSICWDRNSNLRSAYCSLNWSRYQLGNDWVKEEVEWDLLYIGAWHYLRRDANVMLNWMSVNSRRAGAKEMIAITLFSISEWVGRPKIESCWGNRNK